MVYFRKTIIVQGSRGSNIFKSGRGGVQFLQGGGGGPILLDTKSNATDF